MATRSTIALEFADGTVRQVYCHWDGYLEYNGALLAQHYSDPFKLRDLIDLGSLSSLQPEIGTAHPFGYHGTDISSEDYERLYGNMCTFYARDRGESNTSAKQFRNFEDYVARLQHEEYAYILRQDGAWYFKSYSKLFELLAPALAALPQEALAA
jgi:hypothetical protein